jgi:hypothetical protein
MLDIFGNTPIRLNRLVCHSGGAIGSDSYFESIGANYGVKTNAYSYKTKYHTTDNKVEISDSDYEEGVKEITKANRVLSRYGIHKFMNLLARNWTQVKYSNEVFAIGTIIEPGKKGSKGFYNKSEFQVVDGGTGYAVQMAIDNQKTVYVFDQEKDKWFRWSYTSLSFRELKGTPVITSENFAGIGTREIKPNGILAIEEVYKLTFSK